LPDKLSLAFIFYIRIMRALSSLRRHWFIVFWPISRAYINRACLKNSKYFLGFPVSNDVYAPVNLSARIKGR